MIHKKNDMIRFRYISQNNQQVVEKESSDRNLASPKGGFIVRQGFVNKKRLSFKELPLNPAGLEGVTRFFD